MKKKIINIYWAIWRWFKWESKYFHRDFYEGIKNLITWFPIIWCDRNWDSYYILKVLQFKIKRTADYIEKKDRYIGCERDIQIMRTCIRLIDKLQQDYYELEYQDYHKFTFDIKGKYLTSQTTYNNLKEYFKKYPNDYRKTDKNNNIDIHIGLNMSMNRQQRAFNLLFDLLKNNLQKWWD